VTAITAAVVAALAGCGGGSGPVSLARLAADQDAYVGKQVTTSGRGEKQAGANGTAYYVLADAQQDLVILTPSRAANRYVGQAVTVSGRFGLDPHAGRLIDVASIAVSPA